MKITVYPPPMFGSKKISKDNIMEVKEGATLLTVYRALGIPIVMSPILFCFVNHEKVSLRTKLKEGDMVSFMSVGVGG